MITFKDYDPANPWVVTGESQIIDSKGKVTLNYIPLKGSIVIPGYTETTSQTPGLTEFYVDYQDSTTYRTAKGVLQFNVSAAAQNISVSYSGVSTVIWAKWLNEFKTYMETNPNVSSLTSAVNENAVTLASASVLAIGAASGNFITVTGTTAITAFDTVQTGARRTLRFTGALTLTHNATSLILPGAANITTAAGDTATFISLGSGNWACVTYSPAATNLQALWGLTWTEKFILYNPADASVSPGIPLSRNANMTSMDFYVTGTPASATTVTVKQNGTALSPNVSLSAAGKTTLTFSPAIVGSANDLFSYTVAGTGLAACTVVCNQKWVNR